MGRNGRCPGTPVLVTVRPGRIRGKPEAAGEDFGVARDALIILHVDMDAFHASVKQRDSPELRSIADEPALPRPCLIKCCEVPCRKEEV